MLSVLHDLSFSLIWPGDWDDIGFTERPIWVNGLGYGFIYSDENCEQYQILVKDKDEFISIINKLNDDTLTIEDIKDTSLYRFLDQIIDISELDEDILYANLEGLSNVSNISEYVYCSVYGYDGVAFFSTYEELQQFVERDYCDYCWNDLPDEELKLWIERLNNGELEGIGIERIE